MLLRKYHGLGNDYLVLNPKDFSGKLSAALIRQICHRNTGIGSDGILLGPYFPDSKDFCDISSTAAIPSTEASESFAAFRIFNPDGSEAEKSGNGLRIFARFLYDLQLVDNKAFYLNTLGGRVQAEVLSAEQIRVEMGKVSFLSKEIPVTGPVREVLQEKITVKDRDFIYSAANIGNPHCIIFADEINPELAKEYGPDLEKHSNFPNKINVQFVKIIDKNTIALEIWERGAGYTLASGSSACACGATAVKLNYCNSPIKVIMPGGELQLEISDDYQIVQTGPVKYVFETMFSGEWKIESFV